MDKFQIVEVGENFNHAGTKATADITLCAEKLGFKKVYVRMNTVKDSKIAKVQRQIGYYKDWKKCLNEIDDNAIVLMQHPFHHKQLTREKTLKKLKEEKHVKYISIVHDVEELRAFRYNEYYKKEFETMIELADIMVVHNNKMYNWFVENGIEEYKLVNLEIFDYIQNADKNKQINFSKAITVAGNLDTTKCQYISQLGKIEGVKINLYGSNFDENMKKYSNIAYKGSFPVDKIPQKLDEGFGLVWDGESIDGCLGLSGQYLKYNNPHKLSLYLSSGLPVIIWNEAAEAGLVKRYNVGICIKNLYELNDVMRGITENDYKNMLNNVKSLRDKLVEGYFSEKAIKAACRKLEVK